MSHRPFVLPPLRNWQDFEDLCLDLWRRLWNDPDARKNGRSGQPQAGVDVFGRPDGGPEWTGVQCKCVEERLSPKVVAEEVAKARTFEPALSRYVIATTAPSDIHCQKAARKITDLWDLASGACLHTFKGQTDWIRAVRVLGERWTLSGSEDRTLHLWDLATGACLTVFTFDNPVLAVAVVNRIVIVGDQGGNVHFLDLILPP